LVVTNALIQLSILACAADGNGHGVFIMTLCRRISLSACVFHQMTTLHGKKVFFLFSKLNIARSLSSFVLIFSIFRTHRFTIYAVLSVLINALQSIALVKHIVDDVRGYSRNAGHLMPKIPYEIIVTVIILTNIILTSCFPYTHWKDMSTSLLVSQNILHLVILALLSVLISHEYKWEFANNMSALSTKALFVRYVSQGGECVCVYMCVCV
jgi:hypothetical protein